MTQLSFNETGAKFIESGEGDPVICLTETSSTLLEYLAAELFHVLAIAPSALPGDNAPARAAALKAMAKARGLESFALLASGDAAGIALQLAADHADAVPTLALLSPTFFNADGLAADLALGARLGEVKAQVLTLFGTADKTSPPARGGHYKRALATCHLVYVFDAANTASERPQAVTEAVSDFLKRRDAFLVNNRDQRLFA